MRPFDLIATDLDGTFLTDAKTVPPVNARAVRAAAELGIPTVFATGRPARWLHVLDELADAHSWAIATNGAITMDLASGNVVHTRPLDAAVALEVAAEVRAVLPDAVFALEYVSDWSAEPAFPGRGEPSTPARIGELADLLAAGPVTKLLLLDPATHTDALAAAVREIVGDRLTVTFSFVSAAGMLELSAPGVSKALALTELMAHLGVSREGLIAFGDMPNDLAMLEMAGSGYVMSDCHPMLRAAGFPVAGDNNDGGVGRTVLGLLGGRPG